MDNFIITIDKTMTDKVKKREGFLGQRMVVIPQNIKTDFRENELINSLYITDIGYYPNAEHHFRKRNQGSTEYILIYCLEGHGWIKLNNQGYELKPNSYFIIPPDVSHSYGANKNDPWSIYWLHFTGQKANHLFKKYKKRNSSKVQPSVIQIPFEERRIEYFDGIISLLESGYSKEIVEYVNINLWRLLTSFVYNDFFSKVRSQNNESNIVDTAISFMKDNLHRSISVNELSSHLNYSDSYLYSLFKEETGYSPIHYFNHLKIQKACQYLSFTDKSVKEISYELGFNDQFYFSRLFKKLMDHSPTEYRENL